MNDRFLSILVAKIEVWISISIFLAPKMSTVYRPNWKCHDKELCFATVVNPRFKSQVFDENNVWGVRWWRLLKPTALYLQRRHLRRCQLYAIDFRHPRCRRSSPNYATTSTTAPQQRMSAINRRLPTWTLCMWHIGQLSTTINARAVKRDSVRWPWLQ